MAVVSDELSKASLLRKLKRGRFNCVVDNRACINACGFHDSLHGGAQGVQCASRPGIPVAAEDTVGVSI